MEIDWSKAPEDAKAALVAKRGNVHYPKTIFVKDFYTCGDTIQATGCDGRKLDPYISSWDLIERPVNAAWNGEGLPPVGTRCITTRGAGDREVTILAYGEKMVFVRFGDDELIMELYGREFRPIRTQKQIAAEERKKAITEMLKNIVVPKRTNDAVISAIKDAAAQLYDAGYRKVEWPELDDEE